MRKLLGVLLVMAGVVLATAAGAVAFVAAGAVVPRLAAMGAAGIVVVAGVCGLLAFAAQRVGRWPRRMPLYVTAAVVLVSTGAAGVLVLQPRDGLEPRRGAAYWELPTGSRLAYSMTKAQGPARPVPMIRLHGGPGTPGDSGDTLDLALSREGFDVYSYDQLGSGDSPRPRELGGYTVQRQVDDLEAIRVKIGAARVILAGASWGATLAAEYLAAYPGRVDKIVFTSPGALWEPAYTDDEAGDLWDRLTPAQQKQVDALGTGPRYAAWSLLMGVNPQAARSLIGDAELDGLLQKLLTIAGSAATCHPGDPIDVPAKVPGLYANQLITEDQQHRPDPRPALRKVRVPALILRGECDYKAWAIARDYRDTLPNARLLYFPGAGHVLEADRPAEYTDSVTAFLTGRPLPMRPYTAEAPPR